MTHVNETNFVLALAQRLHQAVDAIAGQSENNFDAPIDEAFDKNVCSCTGHIGPRYSAPKIMVPSKTLEGGRFVFPCRVPPRRSVGRAWGTRKSALACKQNRKREYRVRRALTERRAGNSPAPLSPQARSRAGRRNPRSAENVGQSERDHQYEPEKSGQHNDPGQPAAIPKVHEKESHEAHFYGGDRQRRNGIEGT